MQEAIRTETLFIYKILRFSTCDLGHPVYRNAQQRTDLIFNDLARVHGAAVMFGYDLKTQAFGVIVARLAGLLKKIPGLFHADRHDLNRFDAVHLTHSHYNNLFS